MYYGLREIKKKGPITIHSCLGKLFTAVLIERLTKYSDDFFNST